MAELPVFDPDKQLGEWMKAKVNRKFAVVAILGSQSSGKSTLLNKLFGTEFPVMDAAKGRYTCTDGILVAKVQLFVNSASKLNVLSSFAGCSPRHYRHGCGGDGQRSARRGPCRI